MEIRDFNSLFELAVALNIALVAVDYASAFIQTFIEGVFKFKSYVESKFKECESNLADRDTIDHLVPITIDGKSTQIRIEGVKREHEVINADIKAGIEKFCSDVESKSKSKSLSSLSLWLSLYSIIALLVSGMENTFPILKHFWITFSFITIIFIIACWVFGEKEKPIRRFDLSKLRHPITYFASALFFVAMLTYCDWRWNWFGFIDAVWGLFLIISAIIPFVNFWLFL